MSRETVEALTKVLAAHEGAFCICGELTTDPDTHIAAALLDAIDAGQVPGLVLDRRGDGGR